MSSDCHRNHLDEITRCLVFTNHEFTGQCPVAVYAELNLAGKILSFPAFV